MRRLIPLLFLALLGCKTSKNVVAEADISVDSVATSASYRTSATMDSLLIFNCFDFDTLSVAIERPSEIVRLRAVRGKLAQGQKEVRAAVEGYGRLDSVAYKNASTESVVDKSVSTGVVSPPNGSFVLAFGMLVVAFVVIIWLRR